MGTTILSISRYLCHGMTNYSSNITILFFLSIPTTCMMWHWRWLFCPPPHPLWWHHQWQLMTMAFGIRLHLIYRDKGKKKLENKCFSCEEITSHWLGSLLSITVIDCVKKFIIFWSLSVVVVDACCFLCVCCYCCF